MGLKKPLVITDGQIQQLQAGDTLDASAAEVDAVVMNNANAGALVICTPVYVSGVGAVNKASAAAIGTSKVLGLVLDVSVATTDPANIQTDGVFTASTVQWDAVAGTTGGLTAGTMYYLDPTTAGLLTATAPTVAGKFVCPVGTALDTLSLEITILSTVKL